MGRLAGNKILIIDDERQMRHLLGTVLRQAEATVLDAGDGAEGLRLLHESRPDLILLDVLMPHMDGWEVLDRIRLVSDAPVIMLTVLNGAQNEVRALQGGASDYITKPFNVDSLLARVEAAIRGRPLRHQPDTYDDGYLHFNGQQRHVTVAGKAAHLTRKEYLLLALLIRNRDRVCTYDAVLRAVWGSEDNSSVENVHVFVWQLRKKIEPDPEEPIYILNEHGVGYLFASQSSQRPAAFGTSNGR